MIAVIAAHPDDAEISAGGLLALRGGIIITTTNGDNCSRDAVIARKEQSAANAILGVTSFALPDSEIFCVTRDLVDELDQVLKTNAVDTVVTHPPNDSNQEHRLTAQAALAAARRINRILFFEPIPPSGRVDFRAGMYIDISKVVEQKAAAIRAYQSQILREGRDLVETRRRLDAWRGSEIMVDFAEAYQVSRWTL